MFSFEESEIQRLLVDMGTNPSSGLTEVEARDRLGIYGPNILTSRTCRLVTMGLWAGMYLALGMSIGLILSGGPLHYSLVGLCGAIVCGLALWLLRIRMAVSYGKFRIGTSCMGIRDGRLLSLPVSRLVPGDVVRLEAGDLVPADGRLLEAVSLTVLEKAVMGCTQPVEKVALQSCAIIDDADHAKCRLYMGSAVTHGRGTFVVTDTGNSTRISHMVTKGDMGSRADHG